MTQTGCHRWRAVRGVVGVGLLAMVVWSVGCRDKGGKARPGAFKGERYLGWDAHRLDNGAVHVVVVPGIARVMAFGRSAAENLLWQHADFLGQDADLPKGPWKNFGGAKLWVAPQQAWEWPPDLNMDQGPCKVVGRASSTGIGLKGAVSEARGVRLDRKLKLRRDSPVLDLTYTMKATGDQPVAWGIWSVLQMKKGGTVVLPAPEGTHLWDDAEGAYQGLIDGLSEKGIPVHLLSRIIPDKNDNAAMYALPLDGHPAPLAHRRIAEYVVTNILLRAGEK